MCIDPINFQTTEQKLTRQKNSIWNFFDKKPLSKKQHAYVYRRNKRITLKQRNNMTTFIYRTKASKQKKLKRYPKEVHMLRQYMANYL